MATLPDPNSLPHFQWIDETGRTQPLIADVREITDYVIDSNDWPSKRSTVRSVLTRNRFDLECEVCGQKRDTCKGRTCVAYFQNVIAVVGKSKCDIKGAGDMGKGLFANRKIRNGTIIGEYLGRLYPLGDPRALDAYVFLFDEIAECTALQYGNLTRFVNHHCRPNIRARLGMYGKRQVILYEANRDIEAGEQLYVDYGPWYFSLPRNPCRCDAQEGDHLPGKLTPRAPTRSKAKVRASRNAAQARRQRLETSSDGGHGNTTPGISSTGPGRSTRNPKAISSKKLSRALSAAVLNNLTRSAGVSRRYGPEVYTHNLRGKSMEKQ